MNAFIIHTGFDLLAVTMAILGGWLVYRWRFQTSLPQTTASIGTGYFLFLSLGSLTGSYVLGTLNLHISGIPEIGRSILGALFGATIMVELYKLRRGTKGSTGYIYTVPFCICIIIGRLGCLFSGLDDNTHGVVTELSWGWDYGDGVLRHPVQLYEVLSMLLFLGAILSVLKYYPALVVKYGFYLCVGFYASQRFIWEFFKPYQDVAGSLNIFQYACLALIAYSITMILKARNEYRTT